MPTVPGYQYFDLNYCYLSEAWAVIIIATGSITADAKCVSATTVSFQVVQKEPT